MCEKFDEKLNIFKVGVQIVIDEVKEIIKNKKLRKAILIQNIADTDFYEIKNKDILLIGKNTEKYLKFTDYYSIDNENTMEQGIDALTFKEEHLMFKFEISNQSNDDIVTTIGTKSFNIACKEQKEFYVVIKKECMKDEGTIYIKCRYFFTDEKTKSLVLGKEIKYYRNDIRNTDNDWFEIDEKVSNV